MTEDGRNPGPESDPGLARGPLPETMNNYVLLVYAVACFLMYTSLSALLYLGGHVALSMSVPALLGIVLPLLLIIRRFGAGVVPEFSLSRPEFGMTAVALLAAAGSVLPSEALSWLFERNDPANDEYIRFLLAIKPKGIASLLSLGLGIVILSPFGEELLFRGFIQRIFQRNFNGALAVALAAAVFGLSHFNLDILAGVAWFGIVLGYLYLRTGNLFYPFLAHALFNLVSFARLSAASEETIRSGSGDPPRIAWLLASVAALAAAVALTEAFGRRGKKKDEDPGGPSSP
ncbi:MAG: CPBP family intramembrane metalloprotease [Candidatus Krumholzibacteria bacterium]|jgi:membrane protease YdiL (CAAX protease family)|nr:CPBP family intramembrane metalloprotease [Candidatus Krumholzibacteria bacterium]